MLENKNKLLFPITCASISKNFPIFLTSVTIFESPYLGEKLFLLKKLNRNYF